MPTELKNDTLKGKLIISTYPEKKPDDLAEKLSLLGATVLSMPLIKVSVLPFQLENNINNYNWLVFTSKNAGESFVNQFENCDIKIAALGEQTAKRLEQLHLNVHFTGSGKSSVDFVNEFLPVVSENEKVLLVLGNLAPNSLQQKLSKKVHTDRVNVYQTTAAKNIDEKIFDLVQNDQYDVLIVSSPSAIKVLHQKLKVPHQPLRIISIGITTTAAMRELRIEPLATSVDPSYRGLANTTIDYFRKNTIKNKSL